MSPRSAISSAASATTSSATGRHRPAAGRSSDTRQRALACQDIDVTERLAGGPGFEPGLTESESAVLPLNYPPPKHLEMRANSARLIQCRWPVCKPGGECGGYSVSFERGLAPCGFICRLSFGRHRRRSESQTCPFSTADFAPTRTLPSLPGRRATARKSAHAAAASLTRCQSIARNQSEAVQRARTRYF